MGKYGCTACRVRDLGHANDEPVGYACGYLGKRNRANLSKPRLESGYYLEYQVKWQDKRCIYSTLLSLRYNTELSPHGPLPDKPQPRAMYPILRTLIPILNLPQLQPREQGIQILPVKGGVHPWRTKRDGRDGAVNVKGCVQMRSGRRGSGC